MPRVSVEKYFPLSSSKSSKIFLINSCKSSRNCYLRYNLERHQAMLNYLLNPLPPCFHYLLLRIILSAILSPFVWRLLISLSFFFSSNHFTAGVSSIIISFAFELTLDYASRHFRIDVKMEFCCLCYCLFLSLFFTMGNRVGISAVEKIASRFNCHFFKSEFFLKNSSRNYSKISFKVLTKHQRKSLAFKLLKDLRIL